MDEWADYYYNGLGDWYGHDAVAYRIHGRFFPRLQSCIYRDGTRYTKWHTERYLLTQKRAKLLLTLLTLSGKTILNDEGDTE